MDGVEQPASANIAVATLICIATPAVAANVERDKAATHGANDAPS
jgi:hypothetical protein